MKQGQARKRRRGLKYLRQSTAKEETISDEIQRGACDLYGEKNDIDWVTITDPDFPLLAAGEIWEQQSGRVWHKRKGVVRALELVEQNQIDVIVLWKWSRLSRRRLHWALAEDQVHRLGGAILSATEPSDVTTAAGRLNRNVMIDFAEFQSDDIGDVWRETHANRRKRGLPATGGRRFGYRRIVEKGEPERYDMDDDEADTLRWAYQAYIDGMGWVALTWELNRRGVLNSRGNRWTTTSVKDVLDSGFAAGLLPRIAVQDEKVVRVPFSERHWDKGAQKPIVEPETWESYRRARAYRGRHPVAPRTNHAAHPLAGLMRCECGAAMHRKPSGRTHQFVCGSWRVSGTGVCVSVSEPRAVRLVRAWLGELADDVEQAAARLDRSQRVQLRSRADAKQAAARVTTLDKQLAAAFKRLLAGDIGEDAYQMARADLEKERDEAQARLAEAEAAASRLVRPPVELAASLCADWDILPVGDRRDLLAQLVSRVEVSPPDPDAPGVAKSRLALHTTWGEVCALE